MAVQKTTQSKSPDAIRTLRQAQPDMRERDFARIHEISEGELVAAYVGEGATRLKVDFEGLLAALTDLGDVMALTRNESAVHEIIGPFENTHYDAHASMVLGEQIDLRMFPGKWVHGFAVHKASADGDLRRSLQFFDAVGDAVHKIHLRPETNLDAYHALVSKFTSEDQTPGITVEERVLAEARSSTDCTPSDLREAWSAMTDTHQFFGILRRLNLSRHQAMHMIDRDFAWQLDLGGVARLFADAAEIELPIMVFVGNHGCIQIHSGPIAQIKEMGPWINIMDPTFHLHLRQDHITELWAVRKPTSDGHVTSVEAYDADGELIIQFFGKRKEGQDERPEWRTVVEALPALERVSAA